MERVHEGVGPDLARRVGRLRLQRVVLGYRDLLGGSVDLARRRVDHAPHGGGTGRLGDVERAQDVRLEEVPRVDVRVRDRDLGPEVEHDLDAGDGGCHRLRVAQLAGSHLDVRHDVRVQPIEGPALAPRVVVDHCAHPGALADEALDEVTTDESPGSGDEHRSPLESRVAAIRGAVRVVHIPQVVRLQPAATALV